MEKEAKSKALAEAKTEDAKAVQPLTEEQKNAQAAAWNKVAIAGGQELSNVDDVPEHTPRGSGLSTN